jgi:hypothetical protein
VGIPDAKAIAAEDRFDPAGANAMGNKLRALGVLTYGT